MLGQRRRAPLLVLLALAAAGPALGAEEDPPKDHGLPPPDDTPAAPFVLSAGVGYAFRPTFSDADTRHHGGAGLLYGDVPLFYDFALRLEGGAMAWGSSVDNPSPLVRGYVAPQLAYSFDDTEVTVLIGIGGFAWSEVDVTDPPLPPILAAGVLGSLVARWPLFEGTRGELGIRLPFVLWRSFNPPTSLFPLTVMATAGLTFAPFEWFGD